MEPNWPRLPHPTVAWSSADDDDLDRAGFVVNAADVGLAVLDAGEVDEVLPAESWQDGEADLRRINYLGSVW
jgi:hypothetical protein